MSKSLKEHEPFLDAIANSGPDDDVARLIYADWLEERGDPRGEFLRLQETLRRHVEAREYLELWRREQELLDLFDRSWVANVRRYTTARPLYDLAELVPEMAPYASETMRLHPHPAVTSLPLAVSKLGGRFLWPADEPWPTCARCRCQLAPVLQLRSIDVPNIKFPESTDLLQIFWCPDIEAHGYALETKTWWRAADSIRQVRQDVPNLTSFRGESVMVPRDCALYPERVRVFHVLDDLYHAAGKNYDHVKSLLKVASETLMNGLRKGVHEKTYKRYSGMMFYELSDCPGTKVGGKPGGTYDGKKFEHLVTISSWEFDSASFRRWVALEDQRYLSRPGQDFDWPHVTRAGLDYWQNPHGMQLGRTQRVNLYICRATDPWEISGGIGD